MDYIVVDWELVSKVNPEKNCGSRFGYFSIDRTRRQNFSKSDDDYIEDYVIQNQIHYRETWCYSDIYYRFGILAKKGSDGKYKKSDDDFYIEVPRECEDKPDYKIKMNEAVKNLNNASEYKAVKWGKSYYDRDWAGDIYEDIDYKPFQVSYAHSSYTNNKTVCCDTGVIILDKQFEIQTITHSELLEENINNEKGEGLWNNYCFISIKNTNSGEVKTESFFKQSLFYSSTNYSIENKKVSIKAKLIEDSIESEVDL